MNKVLLDTQMVIWLAHGSPRLPKAVAKLVHDQPVILSVVAVWEVAIKFALNKPGFTTEPAALREQMLKTGCEELLVTGRHAVAVSHLPHLHRDPFDRMLIAQAQMEQIPLVTADKNIARYPGPIHYFEPENL